MTITPRITKIVVGSLVGAGLLLTGANAKTTTEIEQFLAPHRDLWGAINNLAVGNIIAAYNRTCTQADPKTITCRTIVSPLSSGGHHWYGPWYWIMPSPAPGGYKYQSASFSLPARDAAGNPSLNATDSCYGDDNSRFQPAVPLQPGNPDTSWTGHKNGTGHFAVCFIEREDANGPKWVWALQGSDSWVVNQIAEGAELDVVYVRAG
jgi:hypothetical protein